MADAANPRPGIGGDFTLLFSLAGAIGAAEGALILELIALLKAEVIEFVAVEALGIDATESEKPC